MHAFQKVKEVVVAYRPPKKPASKPKVPGSGRKGSVARAIARERGDLHFFDPKNTCRKHPTSRRSTSSGSCLACEVARDKERKRVVRRKKATAGMALRLKGILKETLRAQYLERFMEVAVLEEWQAKRMEPYRQLVLQESEILVEPSTQETTKKAMLRLYGAREVFDVKDPWRIHAT